MSQDSSNYCDRWSDDFYDVETCPQEWNWNLQTYFSQWPLDSCQVIIVTVDKVWNSEWLQ